MQTALSLGYLNGFLNALDKGGAGSGNFGHRGRKDEVGGSEGGGGVDVARADLVRLTAVKSDNAFAAHGAYDAHGMSRALSGYTRTRVDAERILARTKPEPKELLLLPARVQQMGEKAKKLADRVIEYVDTKFGDDPRLRDARLKLFAAGDLAGQGVAMVKLKADKETGQEKRVVRMDIKQFKKAAVEAKQQVRELEAAGDPDGARTLARVLTGGMRIVAKVFIENSQSVEVAAAAYLRQAEKTKPLSPERAAAARFWRK